jgi:hypothetical protein
MSALCHHGPWLLNINTGFIRDFTNGYNNCDYYRNGGWGLWLTSYWYIGGAGGSGGKHKARVTDNS